MRDAGQKNSLFKHFSAQGWYALLEVPVFYGGGVHGKDKLITDADVVAFRPTHDLRWEIIVGDCKTLKGQSPANRALWLSGLMKHLGATSGIILLQRRRNQPVESDHKLFASTLGITLLDEDEFQCYDRALVYPAGTGSYRYQAHDLLQLRSVATRFPRLHGFVEFLSSSAWNGPDSAELLRRILGEGRSIAKELDPKRREHLALLLEAAAAFSLGLAACGGVVFHQYLQPASEQELDQALKTIIWGGRERYEFVARLRSELISAKGMESESARGQLALPRWDEFIQLVRTLLEHPHVGFAAPHLLRTAALDVLFGETLLKGFGQPALPLIKLGMLTVRYFCRATGIPADAVQELTSAFAQCQSEILHGRGALPEGNAALSEQHSSRNSLLPSHRGILRFSESQSEPDK